MDKQNIMRSYGIENEKFEDGITYHSLYQFTQLDGEYGPVWITCACQLDGEKPYLHCAINKCDGTPSEKLFSIRNAELAHFVLNILPLFNPLTFNPDALPFQEKES